ncbi:hypothetical protein CEQ90_03170 [Lewinellaceae bacterium SD302]|nr:hypothetical protein CEQ90_03170 [Lewinellaceae bacterium SD302]
MRRWLLPFLLLPALLLWQPKNQLFAQLEGYAEIAILGVDDEVATDGTAAFAGKTGYGLGLDLLYGKSRISPLLGLHLQTFNYDADAPGVGNQRLWHLMVPVGLAYHVAPRTYSFNLMFTAAVAPYFGMDDPTEDNRIVSERNLPLSTRFGLTATLDYLYLGTKFHGFPDGRFGGTNEWSWAGSFLVGVRF